jgi:hypothetical protein
MLQRHRASAMHQSHNPIGLHPASHHHPTTYVGPPTPHHQNITYAGPPTPHHQNITYAGPPKSPYDSTSIHEGPMLEGNDEASEHAFELDRSEKKTKARQARYDWMEAAVYSISDAQILLSIAFSLYFLVSDSCTVSQYHLKIALNLWLTAATLAVFSLTAVRNCFKNPLSGILRFLMLAFSLIFSLGLPLSLQVNAGFTSEVLPASNRNSSQIFLKALCFTDRSFQQVVVDDQINNQAVIGACITNPQVTQEFISWTVICIIWALAMLGRFALRAFRAFRALKADKETNDFADSDSGKPFEFYYWCFILLIWFFALGISIYRTVLIFQLREWVAKSPWIDDSGAETRISGFGQWAAMLSVLTIIMVGLDGIVTSEDEEEV